MIIVFCIFTGKYVELYLAVGLIHEKLNLDGSGEFAILTIH
jgi:hypothetical protein